MDLFLKYETLPIELQEVILRYGDVSSYQECDDMLKECQSLGYTFDYYLDACPFNLRKL